MKKFPRFTATLITDTTTAIKILFIFKIMII